MQVFGCADTFDSRDLRTFRLGGDVPTPPSPPPVMPTPLDVAGFEIDETLATEGHTLYSEVCAMCHGGGAVSGGKAPDLRASPISTDKTTFADVVKNGRQPLGMPRFPEFGDREIEGLYAYIRRQARESLTTASR